MGGANVKTVYVKGKVWLDAMTEPVNFEVCSETLDDAVMHLMNIAIKLESGFGFKRERIENLYIEKMSISFE